MKLALATLALAVAAGCGPTVVQTYPGPSLGPGQASALWSNDHMSMVVDGKYNVNTVEVAERHRFEMAPGQHVIRLVCLFTDDVEYVQPNQTPGSANSAPIIDRSLGGPGEPVLRQAGGATQSSAMITGGTPARAGRTMAIASYRSSRPRMFALDAAAGHSYVPRAHFTRDASGQPACDLRIDDITSEKTGEKVQTF